VTGIKQVDTLQDGVHNLVAGQVGQGGLGQPVSDLVSREGINRAERQGKDDKGSYAPSNVVGGESAASKGVNSVVGGVAEGGKQAAGAAQAGVRSAGGWLGFGSSGGGQQKK